MSSIQSRQEISDTIAPAQLARIRDGLFEALPTGEAQAWREAFLEAIPEGANLYPVYWEFMRWLLIDPDEGVIRFATAERTRSAIEAVGNLYARLLAGETIERGEWNKAATTAATTLYPAYSDPANTANRAYSAAYPANRAAYYAAEAVATDAIYICNAIAAAAAAATSETASAARLQAFRRQAEMLLELLRQSLMVQAEFCSPVGFNELGQREVRSYWDAQVKPEFKNPVISAIFDEIESFNADGSANYEISSVYTRSGNPCAFPIPPEWFEFA